MTHGKPLLLIALAFMSLLYVYAKETPNSEVLFQKKHVIVQNGEMTTIDSVALKINNKYGEEQISVVYDKINKLKSFKAWIMDNNGNLIHQVSKKEVEDRSLYQETALYADERERICTTNHPVYPYRFCYTSTIVTKSILHLAYWEPQGFVSKPLHEAELWIHRPVDYQVRTLSKGVTAVWTDTVDQQVITRFSVKPISRSDEASNNPAIVESPLFVWVVPEHFVYGVPGSMKSWADFGNWMDELNRGLTLLPEAEMVNIRKLVAGLTDTVSIIRIVYHYLQDHTRYVDISLGIGGLKSYPASYVSINKFGDCKALSTYMKALLECVGIKSNYVLVNRDEYPEPFYSDSAFDQFNHVLIAVPVNKKIVWLENTSSTGAMGYVDVTTQDRFALLIDGRNSRLVRTPALTTSAIAGSRRVTVHCTLEGDATISVIHQGRGWEYEYLNALGKDVSAKSQYNYLDRFILFKHYEMLHFDFLPVDRDSMYSRLDILFRMPKFVQSIQERRFLPQIPVYKGSMSFFKPDNHTLRYPFPVSQTDTISYHLPNNFMLENLPEPVTISCPYGKFSSVYIRSASALINYKMFYIQDGTYDPESYRVLFDFIQKVTEAEKLSIVFQLKTNL